MTRREFSDLSSDEFYEYFYKDRRPQLVRLASDEVKDDKDLMLRILQLDKVGRQGGLMLEYLSDRLKDDEEMVCACVKMSYEAFRFASDSFRRDRDRALKAISWNPETMQYVCKELLDDKQFVMDAFEVAAEPKCNLPFKRVSPRLRDDEEVAFVYCREGYFFEFLSDRLRDNEELARFAAKSFCLVFEHASERLRDDAEFAGILVEEKQKCLELRYVSERLRRDPDFMGYICGQNVEFLEFCPEEFRDDPYFMNLQCNMDFRALNYASDRLKQDRSFVWPIIREYPGAFKYVYWNFDDDDEIAWHILDAASKFDEQTDDKLGCFNLNSFSDRLRDNREFVLGWILVNGRQIGDASGRLREDYELCKLAMDRGARIGYLGRVARSDYDMVLKGVLLKGEDILFASDELRNNMVIALAAIHNTIPYHYFWRADDWWEDFEMNVFQYIGDELKKNEEFARIVIKAFMRTYYKDKYEEEELMKDPCQIFDVINKECGANMYYMGRPSAVLDLSEVLAQYGVEV